MPCLIFESSEVLHWLPQAVFPASLPIACLHLQGGIITSRTMPQYQPLLLLLPLPRMLFQLFFTLSEPIPHPCLLLLHLFFIILFTFSCLPVGYFNILQNSVLEFYSILFKYTSLYSFVMFAFFLRVCVYTHPHKHTHTITHTYIYGLLMSKFYKFK